MKFSCLMSIYKNTKVNELSECLKSLYNQTVRATELVIVVDGPIPNDLQEYLNKESKLHEEIKVYPIEQNVGLGNALKFGVEKCSYEMVARMDTDDICALDRFEKQLKIFEWDEELSLVGSNIEEFVDSVDNIVGERIVLEKHEDICKDLKKRCPINHMTVMFKKSEVKKAGGYLHWLYDEDSYLWIRMYLAGCKFYNLQENLVKARVNLDTYARRGGYKYFKSERDLFKLMYDKKIINYFEYLKCISIRFAVYVLMPNKVRSWAFKKFARKNVGN
ncbi:MAG: glycosyltransferase [Clostridia bacterium]|nr:glycosyltransferase [Clostridia bacterium]